MIRDIIPGSRIRILFHPGFRIRIPDPEVKKASDPGSRIRIRNTALNDPSKCRENSTNPGTRLAGTMREGSNRTQLKCINLMCSVARRRAVTADVAISGLN
jgi:hypothetical protein